MDGQTIMITIQTTSEEMAALTAAAQIYLDVLEVVQPLEPNKTRLESIHQLEAFKHRFQEMNAQGQELTDTLFPLQIPFQEFIVLTTAIDAYEFLDKIHCVPESTFGLSPIEVIMLTRSFQRRLVSTPTESSVFQDKI